MDTDCARPGGFGPSQECFEEVVAFLGGDDAAVLTHGELEDQLEARGRELLRQLFQDHLDLRALHETPLDEVVDAAEVARTTVEAGHERTLATVFGPVSVERLAYRRRGHANLHPADGTLNLPTAK